MLKYRVKMTRKNLKLSFPDKTPKELLQIERGYYTHLSEQLVEIIALAGVGRKRLNRLMRFEESYDFEADTLTGSVVMAMAHYGNWEWPTIYASVTSAHLLPVYHKLKSEWAERFFLKLRCRFGAEPVTMNRVGRRLVELKDERLILALIADQTPPSFDRGEWMTFLNQDTKFFGGMEQISRKYNMPLYFFEVTKPKRHHYVGRFVELYDGVSEIDNNDLTRMYKNYLEKLIVENPSLWMWSHNRWKHHKH